MSSWSEQSATGRRLLIVLAVAVGIALFILIWELRGATRPKPSSEAIEAARAEAASGGAADRRAPERRAPPALVPAARDDAPPVEDDRPPQREREGDDRRTAPLAELLAETSRVLAEEAQRCADGTDDGRGTITVSYAVVFEDEKASIDDARVLRNTIADAGVTKCVLDRIAAARWDAFGALDRRSRRIDAFAVGK